MGLSKYFIHCLDIGDKYEIMSPEGLVPFSALEFALDRCSDYIATQKHLDIDSELPKVWDHEWEQFLSHYYHILHKNAKFLESKAHNVTQLTNRVRVILKEMAKLWPQYGLDGMKNVWILKPGNKCRGRGIHLLRTVEDVTKIVNLKLKYVVQKYIGTFTTLHEYSSLP